MRDTKTLSSIAHFFYVYTLIYLHFSPLINRITTSLCHRWILRMQRRLDLSPGLGRRHVLPNSNELSHRNETTQHVLRGTPDLTTVTEIQIPERTNDWLNRGAKFRMPEPSHLGRISRQTPFSTARAPGQGRTGPGVKPSSLACAAPTCTNFSTPRDRFFQPFPLQQIMETNWHYLCLQKYVRGWAIPHADEPWFTGCYSETLIQKTGGIFYGAAM